MSKPHKATGKCEDIKQALRNARDVIEVMEGHLPDWAQDILVEIDNALEGAGGKGE